jgi:hypothetical protein
MGLFFVINRLTLARPCRSDDWVPAPSATPGATYGYSGNFLSGQAVAKWAKEIIDTLPKAARELAKAKVKELEDEEAANELELGDEVEEDGEFKPTWALKHVREPLDSRKEHVVVDQYSGLDIAEGKQKKRRRK